jgi:uncharacterized protein (TIGR00251 family)
VPPKSHRVNPTEAGRGCQPSDETGTVFPVRVVPKASRSEIVGSEGGTLKVRIAAPPVKGKANKALVKLLAKTLGVSGSQVEIISGHKTRRKTVRVYGADSRAILDMMRTGRDSEEEY